MHNIITTTIFTWFTSSMRLHPPIYLFYLFLYQNRVVTKIMAHSWPILSYLKALCRETLLTQHHSFRTLYNQLIEEILNSPFGHMVNLNLLQQLGTPTSGCLKKILPSVLFLEISSCTAINVPYSRFRFKQVIPHS